MVIVAAIVTVPNERDGGPVAATRVERAKYRRQTILQEFAISRAAIYAAMRAARAVSVSEAR